LLGKVIDEHGAIARINQALANPFYDLFGNNCEHFVRFVVSGKRESAQVAVGLAAAGLLALLEWGRSEAA
jgi:hypothetical protein